MYNDNFDEPGPEYFDNFPDLTDEQLKEFTEDFYPYYCRNCSFKWSEEEMLNNPVLTTDVFNNLCPECQKPLEVITEKNRYPRCWKCGEKIDRLDTVNNPNDYPYGNCCSNLSCRKKNGLVSLRKHPMFGKGSTYDRGNMEKYNIWINLPNYEKRNEYLRHRCPPPSYLLNTY